MSPVVTPRNSLCPEHLKDVTETGSEITHPGLTITVYRVNPETMKRTPATSRVLPASDHAEISLAFPPCKCPRCKTKGTAG